MSIKMLQEYTRYSKYSRYLPELKRRETWEEQINRVFDMHEKKLGDSLNNFREDFDFAKTMVLKKRVLGSQRALQFGGKPILDKNAKLYNCTVSYVDRVRFFQECMYLLLCGCGVGFSVQTHHIKKLPNIEQRKNGSKTYVIPDTIEGWADAFGVLLASYFVGNIDFKEYHGFDITFDYTKIRPAGAPLSWGGKAPGPKGLKQSIEKIDEVLKSVLNDNRYILKPIEVYDIIMHMSDAVISGGVRRSATICIFSPEDTEMLNAKTGDWFIKNPQRGRSNNSALLIRDETKKEDFENIMKSVKEFGEPGFIWAEDKETLYNPCFHPDTRLATEEGLVRIKEMFDTQKEYNVVIDKRAGKGDLINKENIGIEVVPSSKVKLTQKDADIYELVTEHGNRLKITDNHEIPTNRGRLKLKDIQIGDEILLQSEEGKFGSFGSYNQGFILGLITGDGCISGDRDAFIDIWEPDFESLDFIEKIVVDELKNVPSLNGRKYDDITWMNQTSNVPKKRIGGTRLYHFLKDVLHLSSPKLLKERVDEIVFKGSKEFVTGYLSGLFFTDGSVQISGHAKKTTVSVRLNQSNEKLLNDVQILLNNFGIVSRIYSRRGEGLRFLPDGNGSYAEYFCKENFELIVNRPNSIKIQNILDGRKKDILKEVLELRGYECNKPERYITKVKSINFLEKGDVYCLYQEKTNTVIANGLVVGQCVEICMQAYDSQGVSGWQFCNLCELNMKKCKTKEDFLNACKAAAIIGTIQASYDSFSYLGKVTEDIVKREALLGCSMTGMMDNPEIAFDKDIQKQGAELILEINEKLSKIIGINQCSRSTCVKPAGSTSCLLGSASGIHPHHAKRYFRRVQANINETPLKYFQLHNPRAVEKSVWSNTGTDLVITFLCEVPDGAKLKNQINAIQLLEYVKLTQQNWVEYGTRKNQPIADYLRHNVSNTITVKENEWDDVTKFIFENRKWFAGISLLPMSGDLDYPQAPFAQVLDSREILQEYGEGSLFASGLIVDGLKAFDDNLWAACDCALGVGEKLQLSEQQSKLTNGMLKQVVDKLALKEEWIRRFKQFAERYCNGNYRRCTHLLKYVSNYKLWVDLKREYQEVDWSLCLEDDFRIDVTTLAGAACSGPNGCEMK